MMKKFLKLAGVVCVAAGLAFINGPDTEVKAQIGYTGGGGSSLTVGTAATIPMWNATPDDLVDSALSDDGTNVTTTEAMFFPDGAVGLPAVSNTGDPDTGYWFSAANTLSGSAGGELLYDFKNLDAAGTGGDIWTFTEDLPILDGSDTVRALFVSITNADHTGASNFIYGVNAENNLQDAQANEWAFHASDTTASTAWDAHFTSEKPMVMGSMDNSASFSFKRDIDNVAATTFRVNGTYMTVGSSGEFFDLGNGNTITASNGADVKNGFSLKIVNANHTGGADSNTLTAFHSEGIVADADAATFGVDIEAGWDYFGRHGGIAHANLDTPANGTFAFCTDCDPASTPCTTGGASTGAFAFRVNGAWDCPW